MSISAQHIIKEYGQQKALFDVSFEIRSGEIVGFLGPNGAGKSTMMKIITCYIPPTSGSVKVCGHDVMEESIEVRRKVGYLPEHNPLYLDMYVKEYLEFVAGLHKMKKVRDRVAEMITTVGLTKEQHKKIGALSKGYRQRVGLAQAMIHDPEVLILDEPTTGLDPNQLVEIRNLIKRIGETKTVMLSTHIMQEVEAICDRVIIINNGEIATDQTSADLQTANAERTVVNVEFDKEVEASRLESIEGVETVHHVAGNEWQVVASSADDIRPAISRFAQENDLLILTMQQSKQSMEEVFKKFTT